MRKWLIVSVLFLIALLNGCNTESEYHIEVTKELYFQNREAAPLEIKVTEDNKAVKGLSVSVQFSMANMDHGVTEAKMTEEEDSLYTGEVKLPMDGKYEALFLLEKDGQTSEKVMEINVTKPKGVAKINDQWITDEDIQFYKLINKLQLEITREAAKKNYSGAQLQEELAYLESQEQITTDKNQLLTQIIRLRSMAMLANEKGHQATEKEVGAAVAKARDQYNQFDTAMALIKEYGEEKFWATEQEQYQMIVLSQKVQNDLLEQVKKENPDAGEQEIYYQAQKQYEELLVSQVNSLTIEIL